MASIVDICNLALSELGNKAQVVSIDPPDGSVEADLCRRFFAISRDEILEAGDWSFARTRAALAELATNPSTVWDHAYALPSDCMVTRRIITEINEYKEDDSADFEVEGDTLFTDRANAILIYTRPIEDPTKFSPGFVSAMAAQLGSYLAGPILRGESGTNAALTLRKLAAQKVNEAMSYDANRRWSKGWFTPGFVAARGGNLPGSSPNSADLIYPQSGYAIS